jgi:hypothetical protein
MKIGKLILLLIQIQKLLRKISKSYPKNSLPTTKSIFYQHWTHEDFVKITQQKNAFYPKHFSEYHFLLSHVHRLYLPRQMITYKYVIYTEHDMILSNTSFETYTQRYRELWKKNWLYGFYRYSKKEKSNERMVEFDCVNNSPVFSGQDSGINYVWAKYVSYTGMWVLDYEQFQNFRQTRYFISGEYGIEYQYNLSPRERVAFGSHYGDYNGSYMSRVLFPLIEEEGSGGGGGKKKMVLDPLAGIHHSSNKYASQSKYSDKEGFIWDDVEKIVKPLPCLVNTRPEYVEKDDLM